MIRLELVEPIKGKTTVKVTPEVANLVREKWSSKDYASDEQRRFVENVLKIRYSPEQIHCLHRYMVKGTFSMGKSPGYTIACTNCDYTYATDTKPPTLL